jgi:leader peptidase (prepilin peptidase) / N-methyltransferase
MNGLGLFERITLWPWAEGAAILWGFWWGALFGSFINVVAHRLPRGESLIATPSRCPQCGVAVRPWDNVPVLGWLWLRGRCRDCSATISAHYPLVEAGCGMLVMLLAVPLARPGEIDRLLRGDLGGLACFMLQAAVVLTIVAWSQLDRVAWRPPSALGIALPLAGALAVIAAVPEAGPRLAWAGLPSWLAAETRVYTLVAAGLGIMAGGLVALGLGLICGSFCRGLGLAWGLPLAGSVLGWEAAVVCGLLSAAAAGLSGASPGLAGLFLAGISAVALAAGFCL